jgi:hypothetical protein
MGIDRTLLVPWETLEVVPRSVVVQTAAYLVRM